MDFWIIFKVALRALARNKMRTFLTMLGIIIGAGSCIAMLSITSAGRQNIMKAIQSLGDNLIIIIASSRTTGGVSGGWGTIVTMKPEDALAIQKQCPHVKYASPAIGVDTRAIFKNRNWNTAILGGTENLQQIQAWNMGAGSFFTEAEVTSAAKVCIIGRKVMENLFNPGEEPTGSIIRISRIPFRVIGVLESKGASGGSEDQDDVILIPYTTMMARIYRQDHIRMIMASASSRQDMNSATEEITGLLRQRHRIRQGEDSDFEIHTQQEIMEIVDKFARNLTILLGSVASVSLLVGGIGIMNIMLVSLNERIREIGIRMAVGARRKDILNQFLIEAVTLSVTGGIIGIGFGYVAAVIVKGMTKWNIFVSVFSIAIAVGFAGAVGVFFGFYPAWRASKLDPIQALRHE